MKINITYSIAFGNIIRVSPKGGDQQVISSLIFQSIMSEVCHVFSNRVLPSIFRKQPMATAIAYIIWGSLFDSPVLQLKGRFPMPGPRVLVR